ncbi:hypothetical protein HELRODRAFT_178173 [Helobdella robusta]|uniref:Uncharacterized protein n=1 Tax=Helobdella robusta TaxID=6412 RepID=T1FCW0_HELRO|nr:hypothetical protein HELRODRAFT_178173 [Helobdella robusta]ESN97382.1 hypothetical protein HELRODRAFT_178173 [Helobdella robusta]
MPIAVTKRKRDNTSPNTISLGASNIGNTSDERTRQQFLRAFERESIVGHHFELDISPRSCESNTSSFQCFNTHSPPILNLSPNLSPMQDGHRTSPLEVRVQEAVAAIPDIGPQFVGSPILYPCIINEPTNSIELDDTIPSKKRKVAAELVGMSPDAQIVVQSPGLNRMEQVTTSAPNQLRRKKVDRMLMEHNNAANSNNSVNNVNNTRSPVLRSRHHRTANNKTNPTPTSMNITTRSNSMQQQQQHHQTNSRRLPSASRRSAHNHYIAPERGYVYINSVNQQVQDFLVSQQDPQQQHLMDPNRNNTYLHNANNNQQHVQPPPFIASNIINPPPTAYLPPYTLRLAPYELPINHVEVLPSPNFYPHPLSSPTGHQYDNYQHRATRQYTRQTMLRNMEAPINNNILLTSHLPVVDPLVPTYINFVPYSDPSYYQQPQQHAANNNNNNASQHMPSSPPPSYNIMLPPAGRSYRRHPGYANGFIQHFLLVYLLIYLIVDYLQLFSNFLSAGLSKYGVIIISKRS